MEAAARRGAGLQAADMDGADASSALRDKPLQRVHPSSYVSQIISRLRIRNLLAYEDSGWIELGRRTLIVGPNGSGKTNMIRALRLLRAAVGLEGGIQRDRAAQLSARSWEILGGDRS
jgi:ABC-type transport system involved in cytochrome bd biosynthesis fused ATPase/permease subunit